MSSYLVLARKYRPTTFADVVGQEAVTKLLQGAIEERRIGHAYLFSGPRGTGKTTLARILAKCLNCEQGPTASPCGSCERCTAADAGSEVDIIELDAASHTGVDTIRELRDEVVYAPMRARHKVYIIDEVHMLSKAAFNALLKTLEEPPPHVVFLFATTEPHKVLDTILSRCQVLKLSALPEEQIARRLDQVFGWEGVEAEPGVTAELARSARGGMRDALSQADKLLALAGRQPTLSDLASLAGELGTRELDELLAAVEEGDRAQLFGLLAQARGEPGELAAGLLESLRTALVLVHCGAEAPFVQASPEERAAALERGRRLGAERLELWLQELLRARERMRLLPDQSELVLEATLLDLCQLEVGEPLSGLLERLEALEAGGAAPPASAAVRPEARRAAPRAPQPAREPARRPAPTPGAPTSSVRRVAGAEAPAPWTAFLERLGASHGALATLLGDAAEPPAIGPQTDEVRVAFRRGAAPDERQRRLLADRRNHGACERALGDVLGRAVRLRFEGLDHASAPEAPASRAPGRTAPPPSQSGGARGGRAGSGDPGKGADPAQDAPRGRSRGKDAFTEQVADLFGGVVEDLP